VSHDWKPDLVTIQGNLTGDQYIKDVLQPVFIPPFDNHPLATRPVYMDGTARPHRSRAVTVCPVVIAAAIPDAMLLQTDTGGSRGCIRRSNMSQVCSMGFKSRIMAGQGTEVTASLWR
jgi:hypothetical protein